MTVHYVGQFSTATNNMTEQQRQSLFALSLEDDSSRLASTDDIPLRKNHQTTDVLLPNQRLSYNELRNAYGNSKTEQLPPYQQRRFSFNAGASGRQGYLLNRVKSSDSVTADVKNADSQPVDVLVSNLDYNMAAKEWKSILMSHFKTCVDVLDISMEVLSDDSLVATVKLRNMNDARLAISQFHRKKIGYKRIQVKLRQPGLSTSVAQNQLLIKQEVTSLLSSVANKQLPVTKFLEMYELRYHRSLALAELFKLKGICEIKESVSGGRIVMLSNNAVVDIAADINNPQVCGIHCREGSLEYMQALDACLLPCVLISLKTFKHQVHKLLQQHNGLLPVASFPACYKPEFGQLSVVKDHPLVGGVYLEHLIAAVSGVKVMTTEQGSKTVAWDEPENNLHSNLSVEVNPENKQYREHMLQFSRESVDLLRLQPGCRLLLSKFIPTYHHQFGRQCRVADYGFSKLAELMTAFPQSIEILGTGPVKILTLTHRIQIKRFTSDLIKILKFAPGRSCKASELPYYFHKLFQRSFIISDYGVCYLEDLLEELPEGTIEVCNWEGTPDLVLALPQRPQNVVERTRTAQFAMEVLELLRQSPRCRIPFGKFIPSYHHFYGRQVRVADFGFGKLIDLLESIPSVIRIIEDLGEKYVCLTRRLQLKVFAEQTLHLLETQNDASCSLSVSDFITEYIHQQGLPFYLTDFSVQSLQELLTKIPKIASLFTDENGQEFVRLADRHDVQQAAKKVLSIMLERSSDFILEDEMQQAYGCSFNLVWLQDELQEIIEVVQLSGVNQRKIMLRPITSFARDLRRLLKANQGKLSTNNFELAYQNYFGIALNPMSYGWPSVSSLIAQVPYVCQLRGRGIRSTLLLCDDFVNQLAYRVAYCTEPQYSDIDEQIEFQEAMLSRFPSVFSAAIDLSPGRLLPITPLAVSQSDTGHPLYIQPTSPLATPLASPTLASPVAGWASPNLQDFTPVKQMIRGLQLNMAFSDQNDQLQQFYDKMVNDSPEMPNQATNDYNVRAN